MYNLFYYLYKILTYYKEDNCYIGIFLFIFSAEISIFTLRLCNFGIIYKLLWAGSA